ncbi:MAG TPA: hypothetical protein VMG33_08165 [Steroidobacteraceae bacterium]|nr:hypothetical protein [Steroidobacteraceae bacterium]
MHLDRRFLVWGLGYAALGLALGVYMAASHNHGELVTHTHILLVGLVLSSLYGIIHRLWLRNPKPWLANLQFWLHQLGTLGISIGLFLLYGQFAQEAKLEPVLGVSSVGVLIGALLMLYMVVKFGAPNEAAARP